MRCPESVLVTVTTVLTLVGQVVPGPSVPNRAVNEPLQSFTVPESCKPTSANAVDAKTITGRLFRYHRLLKPRRGLLWPLATAKLRKCSLTALGPRSQCPRPTRDHSPMFVLAVTVCNGAALKLFDKTNPFLVMFPHNGNTVIFSLHIGGGAALMRG